MKTILHITRMNFLSNKAHVYTTAKTCEALATQKGIKVILLSSDNSLMSISAKLNFFEKNNVKKKFDIVSLSSIANTLKDSNFRWINWLETLAVNYSIFVYIISHRRDFDILYFRDSSLFVPILAAKYFFKKPIFMELHAVLHKKHSQVLNNFFSRLSDGIITISHGLEAYYEKINSRIIVAFCAAAEPERFDLIKEDKDTLRRQFDLPLDKTILMYAGNLYQTGNYDSYGIEDIVRAMINIDESIIFVGVGKKGHETVGHEDLARSLGVASRVTFLPWVPKQTVYRYWKTADILILPAAGAQVGNSPTKMFEYLITGKLIVAARTQAIEEVLVHDHNALLVTDYKNPQEWADPINRALQDKELSNRLIQGALEDSKKYRWEVRGQQIANFIRQTIS